MDEEGSFSSLLKTAVHQHTLSVPSRPAPGQGGLALPKCQIQGLCAVGSALHTSFPSHPAGAVKDPSSGEEIAG